MKQAFYFIGWNTCFYFTKKSLYLMDIYAIIEIIWNSSSYQQCSLKWNNSSDVNKWLIFFFRDNNLLELKLFFLFKYSQIWSNRITVYDNHLIFQLLPIMHVYIGSQRSTYMTPFIYRCIHVIKLSWFTAEDTLIDWLVFNPSFSSISAIPWHGR